MVYLHILLSVKQPEDISRVRDLLTQAGHLSRQEPGCLRWEAYQSQNDQATFVLHERWESPTALDAHRKAEAYTTIYQPQVLPLVTRVAHPCTLLE